MKLGTALGSFLIWCAATSAVAQQDFRSAVATADPTAIAPPAPEQYRRLAEEVDQVLKQEVLAKWYPTAIDRSGGGYWQNFNEDWSRSAGGTKAIVYQARLTWTAAQAAARIPEQAEIYTAHARHGLEFLANKMWDQTNGGFYWVVDNEGNPLRDRAGDGGAKQAYGNAFGMYAAAAVYKLTRDPAALELAQKAFAWYDTHGHDAEHGGYFEILSPEGKPSLSATPAVGGGPGSKSMNSSIHLLEAFTSLYEVWPNPTVKARLQEMFELVRDRIYREPGYLVQFFAVDWTPKENDDSYGHDIETAYLLIEAAGALGIPNDAKAWDCAKTLVDHALSVGWDQRIGGFYDSGAIGGGKFAPTRQWWVEAEGLNVLLLLHERYGNHDLRYWSAFRDQWKWINQYGIDHVHGGWWPRVNNDGTPVHGAKSDLWTECYHQGRSLMNVSERLRNLARQAPKNDFIHLPLDSSHSICGRRKRPYHNTAGGSAGVAVRDSNST